MSTAVLIGPVRFNGKDGFLKGDGSFAIAPRFESARSFSENLASFKSEGKYGFINTVGTVVIPPEFEFDSNQGPYFSSGLAAVGLRGDMGYIDRHGRRAISSSFYQCGDFVGNHAIVVENDSAPEYALIDKRGEIVTRLRDVYELSDGIGRYHGWSWDFFPCYFLVESQIRVAWLDRKGRVRFPPKYPWMTNFWDQVAGYCELEDDSQNMFGLVNKAGEVLCKPQFYRMGIFREGLASAGRDLKRKGFIDAQGQWVIEPKYRQAQPFSEGLACVTLGRKKGFINKKGEMRVEPRFERASMFCDGFAQVEFEGQQAVIDQDGRVIWESPLE